MPIHPIGVDGRKGSAGSPYAISDYRVLHPDLGTDEDFDDLVSAAHEAGLKVIIDVVFNHTSPDSVLVSRASGVLPPRCRRSTGHLGSRVARHHRSQASRSRPGPVPHRLPCPLGPTGRGRVPVRRRFPGAGGLLDPGAQRAGAAPARAAVARGVREPGMGVEAPGEGPADRVRQRAVRGVRHRVPVRPVLHLAGGRRRPGGGGAGPGDGALAGRVVAAERGQAAVRGEPRPVPHHVLRAQPRAGVGVDGVHGVRAGPADDLRRAGGRRAQVALPVRARPRPVGRLRAGRLRRCGRAPEEAPRPANRGVLGARRPAVHPGRVGHHACRRSAGPRGGRRRVDVRRVQRGRRGRRRRGPASRR